MVVEYQALIIDSYVIFKYQFTTKLNNKNEIDYQVQGRVVFPLAV